MSSNRLVFDGLQELRAALRKLPADLAGEGGHIVEAAGNAAVVEARRGYLQHRRTGKMAGRVGVTHRRNRDGATAIVTNTDPQALTFEVGSQARHTDIGANRGSMPPGNVFYPAMRRHRRWMWEQLKALLVRHGLLVTGDAG